MIFVTFQKVKKETWRLRVETCLEMGQPREREWSSQGIRGGKSNGPYYTDEHDEGLLHVKYFVPSELRYMYTPLS